MGRVRSSLGAIAALFLLAASWAFPATASATENVFTGGCAAQWFTSVSAAIQYRAAHCSGEAEFTAACPEHNDPVETISHGHRQYLAHGKAGTGGNPNCYTGWIGAYQYSCDTNYLWSDTSHSCVYTPCPADGTQFTGTGYTQVPVAKRDSACSGGCSIRQAPDPGGGGRIYGVAFQDGTYYGYYVYSGTTCPVNDTVSPVSGAVTSNGQTFQKTSSGAVQVSTSTSGQYDTVASTGTNCGTVNGQPICAPTPTSTGCGTTPGGNTFCVTPANVARTTPPAPNNGTSGTAATPIAVVQDSYGTIEIYGTSATSGSSYQQSLMFPAGGSGSGTGTGTGEGSGLDPCGNEAEGEPPCKIWGTGDGSFDAPQLEQVDTFGGIASGFMGRVRNSPIGQAFTGWGIPSGGTCPTASFDVLGSHFVMDAQCTLLENVRSFMAWAMFIVYAIVGLRILGSA